MMPSTSVSPAAMRKSVTPNCRPFSDCSKTSPKVIKKGRSRALLLTSWRPSLHLAILIVRVLVLLEDGLLDAHLDVAVRQLLGLEQVEVLDRVVVDVEGEWPAQRVEVRLLHRLHHAVDVLQVALHRLDRGV